MEPISRRQFLTYLGVGAAAMLGSMASLHPVAQAAAAVEKAARPSRRRGRGPSPFARFRSLPPLRENDVIVPKGFTYTILASFGDTINAKGERFGDSADLTVYFPIDALSGGTNAEDGLLWVNHEFPVPGHYLKLLGIDPDTFSKDRLAQYPELLRLQKQAVGGSVIRVRNENGTWRMVQDERYNRRIDATTPMQLTGPARGSAAVKGATVVEGTLGNCGGGRTLWNTVLSCEENTEYGRVYGWPDFVDEHYGWVVEIDPFNPDAPIRKHTALGRFAHENAAMTLTRDGRVVVYMGDDKADECFYKFVSAKKYNPHRREANFDMLESGTLYVADLRNGRWIPLDYETNEKLRTYQKDGKPFFKSQADVLTYTREAARAVGGTPLDRPEDVEIHPLDGTVYLALTNNPKHGNFYGQILRFIPEGGDHGSDTFTFEVFAVGGPQSGLSCPDNLCFDSAGNLWVAVDYDPSETGAYAPFGNCGFFLVPTDGRHCGEALQFLSGPDGCETTGPCFTPDEKTLFLGIQHPDTWNPHPRHGFGRSAVIAVTRG
ncbi:PhoX family protein [Calditerricola satsumensis]|uniref:DUF839 domain-containing protein n=1 Tax=Calditerricola satsumensis TaxID=373054 RepID=A0A8J3BE96_9BACI|nr:alkaline phosphatase PhoX [Calditerricola satsumensis]GGK02208.1 hypothetical protein GCM10007043_15350 [Calditerricola satsumensis]